jgi:hypothetical protein
MTNFKVGDKVLVYRKGDSTGSKLYFNKIGTILKISEVHVLLDVDLRRGGIYMNEIKLVEEYKKEIEVYGIVKFTKEYYK